MVLTAVDDPEASTQIWKLCKERKISANIADVPPECDFYFGSVHRDGPLQIMVSTNGNGPKLASIVRKQIAATLPNNIGAAIQNVGALRKKLRLVAPDIEEGPKRMQWCVLPHGRNGCKLLNDSGCLKFVNHGVLKTSWIWMKKIWTRYWAFTHLVLSQILNSYVMGTLRMNMFLMEASDGGSSPTAETKIRYTISTFSLCQMFQRTSQHQQKGWLFFQNITNTRIQDPTFFSQISMYCRLFPSLFPSSLPLK